MAWEWRNGRRYFYTAVRDGDRVVKRYVGTGPVGDRAAAGVVVNNQQRRTNAEAAKADQAELARITDKLAELDRLADAIARGLLLAAGYHRHHRGPWRKRRA